MNQEVVSRHYLKGSLYCGRCGSRMGLIQANGNGGRYAYFFCIGRMKRTGCEQPYVPVDLIEAALAGRLGFGLLAHPGECHLKLLPRKISLLANRSDRDRRAVRKRWPILSYRLGWMVRPSPEPALLLAAVQMRSF